MIAATLRWIDLNILALGRELRLSYLPPLMVYVAYGISGLTGIVGTFFVKDYLGLSAAFLAALGFWAGIPWALKMPLGHLNHTADRLKKRARDGAMARGRLRTCRECGKSASNRGRQIRHHAHERNSR